MTNVTKHNTKQEWEGNYGENSWVHLLVHWNTISIDDFLECVGEFIRFDVSWRGNGVVFKSLEISCWVV